MMYDAVRAGLSTETRGKRFVQKSYSLGWNPQFRLDKALAISEAWDDEELIRKLSIRN